MQRKQTYGVGLLTTDKAIERAITDIRGWLQNLDIDRYDIKTDYDPRHNVALVGFTYKGKPYEFRSTNQHDCRLNMHAIARVMEFKVRAHIMGIEDFATSMSPYLMLGGGTGGPYEPAHQYDTKAYAVFGLPYTASNEQLKRQYQHLVKLYHPDRVSGDDAKAIASQKISELNEAWAKIKVERRIE